MAPTAILDIDGTLVDTNFQHALAWYRAFRQHGFIVPIWRVHRSIGKGGDQLVQSLIGEGADAEQGARTIVDGWTSSGDVEQTKPEPDLVEAALAQAGDETAVLVGDSVWDREAAERAGVGVIGVLTGGFGESELRDAGADPVFHSVAELRDGLDRTPFGSR